MAAGVAIKGTIRIEGHLHIDGSVEGDVYSNSSVTIGKSGIFTGKLHSKIVSVSGKFNGECHSDSIAVKSTGVATGKLLSNDLVIDKGGVFNGQSSALADAIVTDIKMEVAKQESKKAKAS
ncbi:bactofilin family protein [Psychromonas sp. Urea-02u-13]|uniref:bactofilin family protein n=1 Tax=Psychromonas sp. Urea-02u-13 TaxID=2058326 RepID=UPI001E58C6F6|nr:polymer-forming cytoskeletal protein [Psychromonas sp. Urea-02u-13]